MTALGAIQDKNAHLETSLSAETRLKLDLFSALGDVKRQLEIQTGWQQPRSHLDGDCAAQRPLIHTVFCTQFVEVGKAVRLVNGCPVSFPFMHEVKDVELLLGCSR